MHHPEGGAFCGVSFVTDWKSALFVESEGFEPSSKHSMIYAFYMFSFSLIVERGKVSRLPIPFSVFAESYHYLAKSQWPVLLFDAPDAKPKNRI